MKGKHGGMVEFLLKDKSFKTQNILQTRCYKFLLKKKLPKLKKKAYTSRINFESWEFLLWLSGLRTWLVSMRTWVWSLASLRLRIWHCHDLWCRSQTSSDPALLWRRPATATQIQSPSWELPYACGCGLEKNKSLPQVTQLSGLCLCLRQPSKSSRKSTSVQCP